MFLVVTTGVGVKDCSWHLLGEVKDTIEHPAMQRKTPQPNEESFIQSQRSVVLQRRNPALDTAYSFTHSFIPHIH